MKLRDIAHSRAGDKGNISNISVIAFDSADWSLIEREVTVERLHIQMQGIAHGHITRYSLPQLCALNFVINNALAGGVTRSLALDTHGKCLSAVILDMTI